MGVYLYTINDRHYVSRVIYPNHFLWVQLDPPTIIQSIKIRGNGCQSVSQDGRLLAAGSWNKNGVDVWDLTTGKHMDRFGPSHILRLFFDSTGRYVLYHADRGLFIRDLKEMTDIKLDNCSESFGVCVRARDQTMLIPGNQRGQVCLFHSNDGYVEMISLPDHAIVSAMRWSPKEDVMVMVEEGNRISLRNEIDCEPTWVVSLGEPHLVSYGMFSGNGQLIGVQDIGKVLALEVETGRLTKELPSDAHGDPYEGSKVMDNKGRIIDFATGQIDEGIYPAKWWRALGV